MDTKLLLFSLLIFVLNLPFGMWRAGSKKFSWQWFASIHIPIPFIILIRIFGNVGFGWQSYVFFVSAFFLGQLSGKWLRQKFFPKDPSESNSGK